MDHQYISNTRGWKLLCWNIRGINSIQKWSAIRSKVLESAYDIICLHETKREFFDATYIKKFCPNTFDCYSFNPSHGAFGGTIIIWKSCKFSGNTIFQNNYALSVELTSTLSGIPWVLMNVYEPCTPEGKVEFLDWFHNIDMPIDTDWLMVGDFNLIRRNSDRNKIGGNIHDMLAFNDAINNLRLEELKHKGNKYTWSNC
jgi:exonuclease III